MKKLSKGDRFRPSTDTEGLEWYTVMSVTSDRYYLRNPEEGFVDYELETIHNLFHKRGDMNWILKRHNTNRFPDALFTLD
jgi:hypothetical protein